MGFRIVGHNDGSATDESLLFLVSENTRYKNNSYPVYHENFRFGKQQICSISRQSDLGFHFNMLINRIKGQFHNMILAGWDSRNDMSWLAERAGWSIPAKMNILDIQAVLMAAHGLRQQISLTNALIEIGIAFSRSGLHNAGNDSYLTGEIFLHLGAMVDKPSDGAEDGIRETYTITAAPYNEVPVHRR